jgi:hypothetical protein
MPLFNKQFAIGLSHEERQIIHLWIEGNCSRKPLISFNFAVIAGSTKLNAPDWPNN